MLLNLWAEFAATTLQHDTSWFPHRWAGCAHSCGVLNSFLLRQTTQARVMGPVDRFASHPGVVADKTARQDGAVTYSKTKGDDSVFSLAQL